VILRALGFTLPVLVCLAAVGRGAGRRDVLRLLPIAVGLGLGAASLVWWALMQLPLPSSGWLPALDAMVWMGAGIGVLRSRGPVWATSTSAAARDRSARAPTWAAAALLAAIGALAIASFIGASLVSPHGEWDAWAIWNQHARLFARGYPSVWRDAFSPLLVRFHPSYPLLLPLSVARGWVFAGRETVLVPIGMAALLAASTVLVAATSVARSRTTALGLVTATILLASPVFVREAAGQIADIPLSFYVLTTFVLIAHAIETDSSRWWRFAGVSAGFAAWTKDEGAVFVLVLFAVCGAWAGRSGGWQGVKRLGPLVAGAMPSLVTLAFFKVWLAPPNELVTAQTLGHVMASVTDTHRLTMVLDAFGRELWTGGATLFGVLPILALYVAACGVRRPVPVAPALAASTVIGLITADALAYVLTPYSLTWHLSTSLGRVLLQVLPTLIWAGMMVAGRDALEAARP
jgi:hypothetical protein